MRVAKRCALEASAEQPAAQDCLASGQATTAPLPILLFSAPSLYGTNDMPLVLRWVSVVNPVTYGITGMRDAVAFGLGSAWPSLLVLIILAPISYLLASAALLRRAARM